MSQAPLRQQIIDAAIDRTTATGWSSVTMSRLATVVGVSRQTVYNEVGSKPALAEAMILDELARFLHLVGTAFDAHPDDPGEAVRAAAQAVLERAQDNGLLKAIVSASYGADAELLPLLTTQSASLMTTARTVVSERLAAYPGMPRHLEAVVDMIVRVVLSHVMQPSDNPAATAAGIGWIAGLALTNPRATPDRPSFG